MGKKLKITKIIIALMILALCLSIAPDSYAEETNVDILKNIIIYYGAFGENDRNTVDELIDQLYILNDEQGNLWKNIIDYWRYTDEELVVNYNELPDDLPDDDTLCLLILGFELNDDGTMQDELIGRLDRALACAQQYPNSFVLCTGGGTAIYNSMITEAEVMGEYLVSHGLDEERLIIENRSLTTAQNALFSYDIILKDYPQITSLAIISSSYHIPWGTLLFESALMKAASERHTPSVHVISNCANEYENEKYADVRRFETGGMLQLIGEEDLALEYYLGTAHIPEIDSSDP